MRANRLRQLLDNDQPSLGTRLQSQWPTMVEIIGAHRDCSTMSKSSPNMPRTPLLAGKYGRAIDLFEQMAGMIKIEQESRQHLAVRALSAGIQNVLFSDIRTPADAEECVRAVRAETPQTGGLHGARHGGMSA
jgi:2-keto-3-deoxy-L-rhamnonate aldolase RhmA